ncbi:hypothetical protein CW354_05975 [Marinicaulis flavus]|uniref:Uncharacterized protein n=1 Tax=Hyphococcus luteus TaxID=2058213 RepID=A0A2S7K5V6_9PROT|nr:hypothetical protein CW354_05975 [Marinicaulis flavus]
MPAAHGDADLPFPEPPFGFPAGADRSGPAMRMKLAFVSFAGLHLSVASGLAHHSVSSSNPPLGKHCELSVEPRNMIRIPIY